MKQRLNKYFNRSEFACKCGCGFNTVDTELLEVLTELREECNTPVIINCGCRCSKHNKEVGGAPKSKHLRGIAADIRVKGLTSNTVYSHLNALFPNKYGLGLHDTFLHIDIRRGKWREIYE